MASIDIDFEWPVDEAGYKTTTRHEVHPIDILRGRKRKSPIVEIRGKGGALRQGAPIKNNVALFVQFSKITDPKACLAFANAFGLLGTFSDNEPRRSESLSSWLTAAEELRTWVRLWEAQPRGDWIFSAAALRSKFSTLEAYVRLGPANRPILALRPRSLLAAIWLQFAQILTSDTDIFACSWCGAWFERGIGAKRADAKFCSAAHRAAYHNRERAERLKS